MQTSFSLQQALGFRLTRHHLYSSGEKTAKPRILASDSCGIQAQLLSAAELSLWARSHKLKRSEIYSCLWKQRSLVKTSCMRGTLHLLAASDYRIYMRALEKSRMRHMRAVMSRWGVTPAEGDSVTEAVVEALNSGPLTRSALTARALELPIVRKKAKPFFISGWWGVVRQAIVQGHICFGPDHGRETTYVRVDHWLPGLAEVSPEEAGPRLVRRYLAAFGPATLSDFARWSGISTPEALEVWRAVRDEMLEIDVEGQKQWLLRCDLKLLAACQVPSDSVRLLPNFDSYMLGHAEKAHLLDPRWYKRVYRNAGWISPVVLLNGRAVGVWSLRRQGKGPSLTVQPFMKFSRAVRTKIEAEASSLAQFVGLAAELSYGAPEPR